MPSPRCAVRSLTVAAVAAFFACALPSLAAADPPHGMREGGHFAARAHTGGFRGSHGVDRARGGAHWRAGRGDGERWHAGLAPGGHWDRDRGHWHSGAWDDRLHRGWRGDRDRRWHGGDWDDRYWTGGVWLGGDWDGRYWPPVDYGWNYPWYMPAVPYGAVTIWFGDVPYYYVNQVYYVWSPYYGGYVAADPPPVEARAHSVPPAQSTSPETGPNASGVLSLRVVPRKGQSEQQTENDRYACHQWAVAQTGFDPVNPAQDARATAATRGSYRRALTACLDARGYSVEKPSR